MQERHVGHLPGGVSQMMEMQSVQYFKLEFGLWQHGIIASVVQSS